MDNADRKLDAKILRQRAVILFTFSSYRHLRLSGVVSEYNNQCHLIMIELCESKEVKH